MFNQTASTTLATHLEANPRLMGALFALAVLLVQAGNAAAAGVGPVSGP